MPTVGGDDMIEGVDGFGAAGSLPREGAVAYPSDRRRLRLIVEFGCLFVIAPMVMRIAVYDFKVPLFYALPPILALMMAFLFLDRTFHLKREISRGFSLSTLQSIVLVFIAGAAVVAAAVAISMPDRFFALAAERPGKWLKIMALYPFTSVLAQEFVYRVFFFHRYGPLFPNRLSLILANGFVFGLGHVLFRNWIAIFATFFGGMLFAWRYERTRSFWAVWFEHVLWGWLIFTVGLGVYFFTGIKNPAW